jgi:predicted nucleic acid-binding protein
MRLRDRLQKAGQQTSGRGSRCKEVGSAVKLVERMQADRSVQVLPQTHEGFLAGLRLYQARPDKGYCLTDCISMEAMRRQGLNEALTNDEHSSQEGFTCLLERSL